MVHMNHALLGSGCGGSVRKGIVYGLRSWLQNTGCLEEGGSLGGLHIATTLDL